MKERQKRSWRRSRLGWLLGKEKWRKEMLRGKPCLRKSKECKPSKMKSRGKKKRQRSKRPESVRRCCWHNKGNDFKIKRD